MNRGRGSVPFAKRALLIGLALGSGGCAAIIRPPAHPRDPATVILVDYGYHSSLILPKGDGSSAEYAYGQWEYFALNQDDLWHGILAITCPSQGTLGRRDLEVPADVSILKPLVGCREMVPLVVSRPLAEALRARLEVRFRRHPETSVRNDQYGLTFAKDDETYICFHNCNHEVMTWLSELGCEVRGCEWFANFRMDPSEDDPPASDSK